MPESYNPKDVAVTRVAKRGEWVTVEGVAAGRKTSVDIPAETLAKQKTERDREALMKRSVLGQAHAERSQR